MFDFLFQTKKNEYQSLIDIISTNMEKIQLANLAQEKAMSMISKAIAKSEIVLLDAQHNVRKDEAYFRLNVQPNDNQTGTDFWYQAAMQMLHEGDVLIVRVADKYYIARNFVASNTVLYGKSYSSVTVWDGIDTYSIDKTFQESDVIRLRYGTDALRRWTKNVLKLYNDTLSALQSAVAISSTPLFKYKVDANYAFRTIDENGNDVRLTIDEVIEKLKSQISEGRLTIIGERSNTSLEYMKIDSRASVADTKSLAAEINEQCAKAFDIPIGVFNGQITEASDATNEFITYAVQPVAEVITDSLNAKIVGKDDYVRGERALVWLAKFKHRDVLDSADKIDKLRADGFSLDECRDLAGMWTLETEFSQGRVITKNYAAEAGKDPETGGSDDGEELDKINQSETRKQSKHKERRLKRGRA